MTASVCKRPTSTVYTYTVYAYIHVHTFLDYTCHALTVEIFLFSMFGWSGCDSGGKPYVLCFYVLAGYGSQSGTAVYRCL